MSSFVEQATLTVKDKSTKPIRRIAKEIKELHREARKLEKINIRFTGTRRAESDLRSLTRELAKVKSKRFTVSVNTGKAQSQLMALTKSMQAKVYAQANIGAALGQFDRLDNPRKVPFNVMLNSASARAMLNRLDKPCWTQPQHRWPPQPLA